ncbi:MAG: imidazole glycerol phosphate synthase subunit HisH [Polyangiales bacterium]
MTRVTIVDLGLGNLRSVARAFERAGANAVVTSDPDVVRGGERLVVPGQGAFRDAARALEGGLGEALREAIAADRPFLGICLGMHALFERSEEAPGLPGLGVLAGEVRRFAESLRDPRTGARLKVPHMGWNEIEGRHELLPSRGWFYFVHSYYCAPRDEGVVVATADYGGPFCAAVARGGVFACQFHPEKSHVEGARLVERFLARSGGA